MRVFERHGIALDCMDAVDLLRSLKTGSVDLVLTDPPYNVSVRSGREGTTVGRIARTGKRSDGSRSYREIRRDFGGWDHAWDARPFLRQVKRVLRPGGSMIAFTSEFLFSPYLKSGLDHRCLLYWLKSNPAPNFRGHYQRSIEMAVWQTKGGKWTFNANGATPNVVRAPAVSGWHCQNTGEGRIHPNQKPLAVILRLLEVHSRSGDLVVDPYAGSATTLAACAAAGRRCIGGDADAAVCARAVRRLRRSIQGRLELSA